MLAFEPFRLVLDLGKKQRRLDRLKHMRLVKRVVDRISAGADDIRQIFFAAPFGENPGGKLIARAQHRSDFDLRILLFESFDDSVVIIATTVKRHLTFGLRRTQSLVPFLFPRRLRRSEDRPRSDQRHKPGDLPKSKHFQRMTAGVAAHG